MHLCLPHFQNAGDIPVPGGTVYVKMRECTQPGKYPTTPHSHVRRFMVPKNAYASAQQTLTDLAVNNAKEMQMSADEDL